MKKVWWRYVYFCFTIIKIDFKINIDAIDAIDAIGLKLVGRPEKLRVYLKIIRLIICFLII